jgi:hypothetical protein
VNSIPKDGGNIFRGNVFLGGTDGRVSAFLERIYKYKGKDFTFGQDPRASTLRDPDHAHYAIGTVKWTSTLSSRMLFEAGISTSYQHWTGSNQPGRSKIPGTPDWYAFAQKTDGARGPFYFASKMSNASSNRLSTRRHCKLDLSFDLRAERPRLVEAGARDAESFDTLCVDQDVCGNRLHAE